MRKYILSIVIGVLLVFPAVSYSAPSLSVRLNGRILLAVEDMGRTYYVADGYRYLITRATAQEVFKKLALGISNKNLEQIPIKELAVESEILPEPVERIVYVDRYIEKQCSVESYKNEINDLNRQIETLKGDIKPAEPKPNASLESQLNKSYALLLNNLRKQVLDLQDQLARSEQIVKANHPGWNSLNLPSLMNDFQKPKLNEIGNLNREISALQNELEKKLLELE